MAFLLSKGIASATCVEKPGWVQVTSVAFVRDEAAKTLGVAPEVFALSAREALRAREQGDAAELAGSGLPAFEAKVTATLEERSALASRSRTPSASPAGPTGRRQSSSARGSTCSEAISPPSRRSRSEWRTRRRR
jgi:hypothetical protein